MSLPDNISAMSNCDQTPCGLLGTLLNETLLQRRRMAVRPLLEAVTKMVVMAATVCSGLVVAQYDGPLGNGGHEEGQGMRQDQRGLDRAA